MSQYYRENGKRWIPEYKDGRTKQAFKDSTDVNKILRKHIKSGTIETLGRIQGQFGDFSDFDYMDAQNRIAQAKSLFEQLPGELRAEFNNNPGDFLQYANDPANTDVLQERLIEAINPGRQINVDRSRQMASVEPVEAPATAVAEPSPEPPSGDSEGGTPA